MADLRGEPLEEPDSSTAFVICQIGAPGSEIRARTDELCDFVLREPLAERGLRLARADEDPRPGTVTVQIVQSIVNAKVIVADLTGRNPNVYYELGIAHSFAKPIIILVDKTSSLAFDLQGERAITIDDDGREIGARKAAAAADEVRKQLDVVTAPGYAPQSLVRSAGVSASLTQFASDDPVSAQLVRITEQLEEMRNHPPYPGMFIPTASDLWPDYTLHLSASDRSGERRITPQVVRRFAEKVDYTLTTEEAAGLLRDLTLREFYLLTRIWGLDGRPEVGSPQDLALEFNLSMKEAAQVWHLIPEKILAKIDFLRSMTAVPEDDAVDDPT